MEKSKQTSSPSLDNDNLNRVLCAMLEFHIHSIQPDMDGTSIIDSLCDYIDALDAAFYGILYMDCIQSS